MKEALPKTSIWDEFEKGQNFNSTKGIFVDTDKNYRFYNENQWEGLESGPIEPVVFNIIKPIVKYKVGTINLNEFAINYSSENFDDPTFQMEAEKICDKLNRYAAIIWEKSNMATLLRKVSKRACINSEGVVYINVDENNNPECEILKKNNVYYGNENDEDIQQQPYIIISKRVPLKQAIELAKLNGISEKEIQNIMPDSNVQYESGDNAKTEVDDKVTILTKLWKENGIVYVSKSTKFVDIVKAKSTEMKYYPLAHIVWESVEGSARGQGEVKYIIPNQIEINKTLMRIALATKLGTYPIKVVAVDKVLNPSVLDKVGATIKLQGATVDDVKKYVGYIQPAPLSTSSDNLLTSLISTTRELAGAGDVATGDINPEQASGKSILAVQQASQLPLTEQSTALKQLCEDIARIFFDIWQTYNKDGMTLYDEKPIEVEENGIKEKKMEKVPYKVSSDVLNKLRVCVKIDITPKSAYDKLALEQSLENLLNNQYINFKEYVNALPFDSSMPKSILERILHSREVEQQKINQIEQEGNNIQSKLTHYLNQNEQINDLDMEAEQIVNQVQ